MKKKLLSVLLAGVMVLSLAHAAAVAAAAHPAMAETAARKLRAMVRR